MACENLTLTYLIEQEFEKAEQQWNEYIDVISDNNKMRESELGLSIVESSLHSNKASIEYKTKQFQELNRYALDTKGSTTYALDLINYNNNSECTVGSQTSIKPKYDISEIWDLVCSENAQEKEEGIFLKKMENRKDYSNIYSLLSKEIPGYKNLPEEAQNSLIEAERRINDKSSPDFAPCVLAYAKSVEISLRKIVFERFREYSKSGAFDIEFHIQVSMTDKYNKAQNFISYIVKGKHLELGSMAFALKITTGKTAKKIKLLELFNNYVSQHLEIPSLFEDQIISKLQTLAADFRNPAAHSKSFNQEEALRVRDITFEMLNLLD